MLLLIKRFLLYLYKLQNQCRQHKTWLFFLVFVLAASTVSFSQPVFKGYAVQSLNKKIKKSQGFFSGFDNFPPFKPDSIGLDKKNKTIDLHFNPSLSHLPLREDNYVREIGKAKAIFGRRYRKYEIRFLSGKYKVEDLIPNYYRKSMPRDPKHYPLNSERKKILLRRAEDETITHGLKDKHIALWPSHGAYFNQKLSRWEWQRPRLHTTVEDLLPASFVLTYLSPMLENAGAVTLIPRERDIQNKEYIIDNHQNSVQGRFELVPDHLTFSGTVTGFAPQSIIRDNENPFMMGSALKVIVKAAKPAQGTGDRLVARYIPHIPDQGKYAVYISYPEDPAHFDKVWYTVRALDGEHRFLVDQSVGGGMWIYLGHFEFGPARKSDESVIEVAAPYAEKDLLIGLDAIKIGGGMGNVARRSIVQEGEKADSTSWKLSGLPRYMEAARYFMQYSGVPDTIVYSLSRGQNDYTDDYQSRGEWVNYLIGKPQGPSGQRNIPGKGIETDLSFAFHTDAGITKNDSVIGTLAIYSAEMDGGLFPDGRSRLAGRELTDIVQTQIVEDVRHLFNPEWVRRGLWDRKYSEAFRPNVPAMLLELLSHQNLADMVYALDPEFRFHVARAIYKGMLKYLSFQESRDYVVQPLPVEQLDMERTGERKYRIRWKAAEDPLEPTARPDSYRIYERRGNGAFRMIARKIEANSYELDLPATDTVFSYRIVAENKGGTSFPSAVLSVGLPEVSKGQVIVVNAFDRLSGPGYFDVGDLAGFAGWVDEGVADGQEFGFTGEVYDFSRQSLWQDNDSPGWGASHADAEGKLIIGNTFDYARVHGESIMEAGYGFISVSEAAFCEGEAEKEAYLVVDIIYGEERSKKGINGSRFVVLDEKMRQKLSACMQSGISILISGAYIGTDLTERQDSAAIVFARDQLGYIWRTDHADKGGVLTGTGAFGPGSWHYNSETDERIYRVESPDAVEPFGNNASTILRYEETGKSAGVLYNGQSYRVITLGFPLESIPDESERNQWVAKALGLLIQR